ncbi:MAG: radical SAM protein [Candidatus Omnitrophota bacterium]|nr:MAG: radical SAM protein [Candidatus Omnitrophota bacterium]
MKAALVFVPFCFDLPTYVPIGIASIKGYVQSHSRHRITCFDFNQEFFLRAITHKEAYLRTVCKKDKDIRGFQENTTFFAKRRNIAKDLFARLKQEGVDHRQQCVIRHLLHSFYYPLERCIVEAAQQAIESRHYRNTDKIITPYRRMLLSGSPEIIGFSLFEARQMPFAVLLARSLRQASRSKIVFGGGVISRMSRQEKARFLERFGFVDYLIEKEGEEAFLGFLNRQDQAAIPNLTYRKNGLIVQSSLYKGIEAMNRLPVPDYSGFKLRSYVTPAPVLLLSTSRNCPWNKCIFCRTRADFNRGFRQKGVSEVTQELQFLFRKHNVSTFFFIDASMQADYAKALAARIIRKKLGIRYGVMMRCEKGLTSKAFVQRLYDSGCRYILFGVETLTPRLSRLINKGIDVRDVEKILLNCKACGIYCHFTMIFGLPSQTEKDMRREIKILQSLCDKTDFTCEINRLGIDPGTILYERKEQYLKMPGKRTNPRVLTRLITKANTELNTDRTFRLVRLDDIFLVSINSYLSLRKDRL